MKTQIWIAVSVYVLVGIVRKRLGLEASLYEIPQIFSVTLFGKAPILKAPQRSGPNNDLLDPGNQSIPFDFYADIGECNMAVRHNLRGTRRNPSASARRRRRK